MLLIDEDSDFLVCRMMLFDLLVVPSAGNIILLLLFKECHNGKHHCYIFAVI